jgi:L,D-transpeptidase ErfK/SrfK
MDRLSLAAMVTTIISVVSTGTPIPVSHHIVGKISDYTVTAGDTLSSLGSRAGVDVTTLAADNNLPRGEKLVRGHVVRVDSRHILPSVPSVSIVINVPQRMLFLLHDGEPTQGFPVGLGQPAWPTPTGPFSIVTKEIDPTWDVPLSIQHEMEREGKRPLIKVPPGPDNPLGDRWFGLSLPGVGIHGTNVPTSIYHHRTHGCIRLHPDDVRALFDLVPVGARGEIVYQPVLLAVVDGRVYLESHRDVYRQFPNPLEQLRASAAQWRLTDAIDWSAATSVIRQSAGVPRDVTVGAWLTN